MNIKSQESGGRCQEAGVRCQVIVGLVAALMIGIGLIRPLAQIPSFQSFNTNQFAFSTSTPWTISVKDGAQVTNLLSAETLVAQGAFIMPASLSTNLVPGENCLNPYQQGSIWITGNTADPNDSSISLVSGNGQGQLLILQNFSTNSGWTIINGTPFCDASGGFIRLNGDFTTTTQGDGLLLYSTGAIWTEIGRFSGGGQFFGDTIWTFENDNVFITADTSRVSFYTNRITFRDGNFIGSNSQNLWGGPVEQATLISIRDTDLGDQNNQIFQLETRNSGNGQTGTLLHWDGSQSAGQFYIQASDASGTSGAIISEVGTNVTARLRIQNFNAVPPLADVVILDPGATLNSGTFPYLLNTTTIISDTNGVFWLGNLGTNLFRVAGDAVMPYDASYFFDGSGHWSVPSGAGFAINPTDNYLPVRNNATDFDDSGLYRDSSLTNIVLDGIFFWGPGETNALFRSTGDLVYTNGSSQVTFTVSKGSGSAVFGVDLGNNAFIQSGGSFVYLKDNAVLQGDLLVDVQGTRDIGSSANNGSFKDFHLVGKILWNGTTNSVFDAAGTGSPEGALVGDIGSTYRRFDGGANTSFYVKEASNGANTGWQAK